MTYEDTTQRDKEESTPQLKQEYTTVPSRTEILAQEVSAEQLKGEAKVLTRTHTHARTHTLAIYARARTHTHTHHNSHTTS